MYPIIRKDDVLSMTKNLHAQIICPAKKGCQAVYEVWNEKTGDHLIVHSYTEAYNVLLYWNDEYISKRKKVKSSYSFGSMENELVYHIIKKADLNENMQVMQNQPRKLFGQILRPLWWLQRLGLRK